MMHGVSESIMGNALDSPSSPESAYGDDEMLNNVTNLEVTTQLLSAGPIGVAAAAAIASGRKRKRSHQFETNPSIRRRQQTRLLRKLKATIDEYIQRVGQQAIVLCCLPGKNNQSPNAFKVFGSQPLESVIRQNKEPIIQDLEVKLQKHTPPPPPDDMRHDLPPLVIEGIPTPVDKMTQAQLRAFIPEMLKSSTSRSKPGWGKPEYKPVWWPHCIPWANVRSDVRSDHYKRKISWTHALRTIVEDCYRYHNRCDLLPCFNESSYNKQQQQNAEDAFTSNHSMLQTITNPDGSMSLVQVDNCETNQTINPYSTQLITLPDGSQAQIISANVAEDGCLTDENIAAINEIEKEAAAHYNETTRILTSADLVNLSTANALADGQISTDGHVIIADSDIGSITIPISLYEAEPGAELLSNEAVLDQVDMEVMSMSHQGRVGPRVISRSQILQANIAPPAHIHHHQHHQQQHRHIITAAAAAAASEAAVTQQRIRVVSHHRRACNDDSISNDSLTLLDIETEEKFSSSA